MFATIVVAIIAAVATVTAARITSRPGRAAHKAIGTPNGEGTVVEMAERILINLGRLDAKLDQHTQQDSERFDELNDRLQRMGQ